MRLRFSTPPAALTAATAEYHGSRWHFERTSDVGSVTRALEFELHSGRVEPVLEQFTVRGCPAPLLRMCAALPFVSRRIDLAAASVA
jgi:hypothetical protein